jgi:hypothetical protein
MQKQLIAKRPFHACLPFFGLGFDMQAIQAKAMKTSIPGASLHGDRERASSTQSPGQPE